jgi:hypothetical protein
MEPIFLSCNFYKVTYLQHESPEMEIIQKKDSNNWMLCPPPKKTTTTLLFLLTSASKI